MKNNIETVFFTPNYVSLFFHTVEYSSSPVVSGFTEFTDPPWKNDTGIPQFTAIGQFTFLPFGSLCFRGNTIFNAGVKGGVNILSA